MVLIFSGTILLVIQCLVLSFRKFIAGIFTQDPVVQDYIYNTIFWASICIFLDSLVAVSLGIIKGIGKQAYATVAYLICFYLLSVPLSFLFCFVLKLGLIGLWNSLLIGLVILIFSLSIIIYKADWLYIALISQDILLY